MLFKSDQLNFFARYIESQLGIVYVDANYYQLDNRLELIMKNLGISDPDELYRTGKAGITGNFRQLLLDTATNNETSFYRDKGIFAALEKGMIPELLKVRPNPLRLRIWCAACSTGQEPYSIAMMLKGLPLSQGLASFDILATDYSDRVLKRASEGVFSQLEIQRGLPTPLLLKYFSKKGEADWELRSDIKACVKFQQLNLLEEFSRLGEFDIIFLRNMLIYQNVENKKKIVDRMADRLCMDGFLAMGAAESMMGVSDRFKQVTHEGAIFYQRVK